MRGFNCQLKFNRAEAVMPNDIRTTSINSVANQDLAADNGEPDFVVLAEHGIQVSPRDDFMGRMGFYDVTAEGRTGSMTRQEISGWAQTLRQIDSLTQSADTQTAHRVSAAPTGGLAPAGSARGKAAQ
jgi:hypothetical protein